MFLVVGCVDLDELWNEIDFLKKQNAEKAKELEEENAKFAAFEELYKSVEKLTNSANSEITSLKGLIDALSNRLSVVSYKELEDKSGYELTMSDGSKITLKHGAKGAAGKDGKDGAEGEAGIDGITPEISVKLHTDGLLYWTLNGEFLLDANGNMIPAQGKDGKAGKDGKDGADGAQGTPGKDGKDGKDGATGATGAAGKDAITPLLRINSDLYWEMSLDGGLKWQLVTDANKRPIKAQGPQGAAGAAGQSPAGPKGPTGDQGAPGEKGEPGKDGDANLTITETETTITIIYNGVTFTIPKGEMPPVKMTLTTTKTVGETIGLWIGAAEADKADVWIDLNNNGKKDSGEDNVTFGDLAYYPLGAQTITIYGKVTMLACFYNSLTTLDVSHNATLDSLYCSQNSLTKLDVTQNTALTVLNCGNNSLSTLDVSHNAALTYLDCYGNLLTTLDVSNNTALQELECHTNSLSTLDVTKNTALRELNCSSNSLNELDLTKNTALQRLDCEINSLTELNLPNSTALQALFCEDNSLTTLDVSKNTSLKTLICDTNLLTALNTSNNPLLLRLHCQNNQLTALDVTNNTALEKLYCYGNQIKEAEMGTLVSSLVDRSGILKGDFYVHDPDKPTNVITQVQVAKAKAKNWRVMDIDGNAYEGIEPPKMTLTTTRNVDETIRLHIEAAEADKADVWIDLNNDGVKDSGEDNVTFGVLAYYTLGAQTVTIYGKVTMLVCYNNSLTTLDVSNNAALQVLDCSHNSLTTLDVTTNTALQQLYCYINSLTELDLTKNTALLNLSCNGNSLTELDLTKNTALQRLYCEVNLLTELDVTKNTALQGLRCSKNSLTELDLTKNTALQKLYCNGNSLTSLDVTNNAELEYLSCYGNQITGGQMEILVNSLVKRNGKTTGKFYVHDPNNPTNVITKAQVLIAEGKNWRVLDINDNDYDGI